MRLSPSDAESLSILNETDAFCADFGGRAFPKIPSTVIFVIDFGSDAYWIFPFVSAKPPLHAGFILSLETPLIDNGKIDIPELDSPFAALSISGGISESSSSMFAFGASTRRSRTGSVLNSVTLPWTERGRLSIYDDGIEAVTLLRVKAIEPFAVIAAR